MKSVERPTASTAAVAILIGFQGLPTVAVAVAFALLGARPYHRRPVLSWSLEGAGEELAIGLVVVAFALFLIAVAVASVEAWHGSWRSSWKGC